jgi:CheY-like chemotaxis protein
LRRVEKRKQKLSLRSNTIRGGGLEKNEGRWLARFTRRLFVYGGGAFISLTSSLWKESRRDEDARHVIATIPEGYVMAQLMIQKTTSDSTSPPEEFWMRLNVPVSACEDAWDMRQVALYYGAAEVGGCCFVFPSEERRTVALEMLHYRFGHKYFENVNLSQVDGRTRLLVVSCDEEAFDNHCRYFAAHGLRVSQASDWAEALAILRRWHPHVVIIRDDMLSKTSNSPCPTDSIKKVLATVPLIFITQQDEEEEQTTVPRLPATVCYPLQVPSSCLLNTIRSIVLARHAMI